MANRLNLIIFGVTGFTGRSTLKHAIQLAKEYHFTFGVAGRRKEAIEAVVKNTASDTSIPIFIADVKDEESLKKMAEQAKVIVNCCGPYRFYGEPLIKACIETKTNHVDVSGEPEFIERMQLKYNAAAKEAGIYIVSACGFDSIPCDLGVIFTQKKFDGEVNTIESYLYSSLTKNASGSHIAYGTWESLIYGINSFEALRTIRKKLYSEKLPNFQPKLKNRCWIHKTAISEGWSTIFLGSDRSVAYRTQRFLFENFKQRPAQIQTYVTIKSFFTVLLSAAVLLTISLMAKITYGRNLLLKYPRLFSLGYVSRDDPNQEIVENTHFSIIFKTRGWTEKLAEPTDNHLGPPNKEMITKVSGVNPGYGVTCIGVLLAAVMILKESDKMPQGGGVFSPGAAFYKTSIIEELIKHGLTFEVISSIEN